METSANPQPKASTSKASPKPKRKSKASQLSKQQFELLVKKKIECNAKAQKVVIDLLEPVTEENLKRFKSQLKDITQVHYEDVIEERAITRLCGYPLCDKKLENIPAKQYHISLTQNKVYDLTERKNFCGGQCFKASNYLKAQLLTTPLWSRKDDDILPEFNLLDLSDS